MKGLRKLQIVKQNGQLSFALGGIDMAKAHRAADSPMNFRLAFALDGYVPQAEELLEKITATKDTASLKQLAQFTVESDDHPQFFDDARQQAKIKNGEVAFVVWIGQEYGVFVGKPNAVLQAISAAPKKKVAA